MGIKFGRDLALSPENRAIVVETGKQTAAALRRALWEDRQIKAGFLKEFAESELDR